MVVILNWRNFEKKAVNFPGFYFKGNPEKEAAIIREGKMAILLSSLAVRPCSSQRLIRRVETSKD